ncbi:MAG: DUF1566 domain-containing protein [Dysgonamonadaceae bacterium]|jgi:hypothetical protein|nr:DUF1566 domain-containing protein [Dysgonamonadaceae bacterium]
MKRKMIYLALMLLIWSAASVNAQVTIGSDQDPHKGAVLDLSQSTRLGLLLPHVSLTNVSDWQLSGDKANGEGMVIYNTNEDVDGGNGKGIYVWKDKWFFVQSPNGSLPCSGLPEITETSDSEVLSRVGTTAPELTVTVNDKGDSGLTYRWQRSANGLTGWTEASGEATTASYTVPNSVKGTFYYRCMVKNDCGTVSSPVFKVMVHNCPGYVCTGCAYDYPSDAGNVAKDYTPTTTDTDETWAPNVKIGALSYTPEDTQLFDAFISTGKDLCVYKTDANIDSYNYAAWPNAVSACSEMSDGADDWYLPNLRELRALYDALGGNGNSDTGTGSSDDFAGDSPMRSNEYWSSTEYSENSYAYYFTFSTGSRYYYYKTGNLYVRCVRRM